MKVGVCGACGRMGREVCRAVGGESDLELACAVDPAYQGAPLSGLVPGLETELRVSGDPQAMVESGIQVMVDFSLAQAARLNVPFALRHGIHCVVGTTGLEERDLREFDALARENGVGCLVAPNFAVGAVLMMDFARRAARFLPRCEIIEMHHPAKLDSPSGTARNTARLVLEERGVKEREEREEGPRGLAVGDVHVHSVRLPGLVAHQEVIFGGQGQVLTIRHDSLDRTSFMPGVIMAVRKVPELRGLVLGLERIMDL